MKRTLPCLTPAVLVLALGASLVGCAGTPARESTSTAIDDSAITARIKAALVADPQTKAREIHVSTYRGIVQLSGLVHSRAESADAERIAMHEQGVLSVKDELQILPSGGTTVGRAIDDASLTARVKAALVANPEIKTDEIAVRTHHGGLVELSGFVDSGEQREAAVLAANGVQGVQGVDDALIVKPATPGD